MGVTDYLTGGTDGTVHYECAKCGENLSESDEACPACGGRVAVYEV